MEEEKHQYIYLKISPVASLNCTRISAFLKDERNPSITMIKISVLDDKIQGLKIAKVAYKVKP
jgi:hypothetical protein